MEYKIASIEQLEEIYKLIQETILIIYPKYYPKEVVNFFCSLHNKQNISKDIKNGYVSVLFKNGEIVGTGSYNNNHITRVYIKPSFQGQGCGSYIMECMETEIALKNKIVQLESSLSASIFYENRGYKTIRHDKIKVKNDVILVYEIMEKNLCTIFNLI